MAIEQIRRHVARDGFLASIEKIRVALAYMRGDLIADVQ
jgi:hypothetical protein